MSNNPAKKSKSQSSSSDEGQKPNQTMSIKQEWKRRDKEKRENAILLQQGGQRYADDDGVQLPRKITEPEEEKGFEFDHEIPAM